MKRPSLFTLVFSLAGGLLIVFILLPLICTLLSTTPGEVGETLQDEQVMRSLGTTFLASAIATGLAFVCGVPLAYLLARRSFWGKRIVEGIIDLPIVIPHTAAGIALLMVFGSKGVLGGPLGKAGLFFTDTLGGIVVAMLFVSLPYLVDLSRTAFSMVDRELERVALIDGANRWQAFFRVALPLAWRGVLSGALMMWSRGISEFGAVIILAYHPKIVPTLIYERFEGFGLSSARPVAVVLIVTVLIVFTLFRWLALPEQSEE